jgi:hypothetical protein
MVTWHPEFMHPWLQVQQSWVKKLGLKSDSVMKADLVNLRLSSWYCAMMSF